MANTSAQLEPNPSIHDLIAHLRRARIWAWEVFNQRRPGPSRDLAWSLINLAKDHDPDTYSPWLKICALEPEALRQAIELAHEICRLIRKADAHRPDLILESREVP